MNKIVPDPFAGVKRMVMAGRVPHRPVEAARDQRIEALESDTLFLSLLGRAMLQVLTDRGLCTMDEIVAAMQDVDFLDGKEDHGLAARDIAEELGVDMPDRDLKKEFTDRIRGK